METKETKEKKSVRIPIIAVSALFLLSGALEFWGLYLTGFRMFTLPLLALAGFAAALGLIRSKPWGLWLSLALYPVQMVQALALLWSLIGTEGFGLSSSSLLLEASLLCYVAVFTVFIALLWKSKKTVKY